jgi:hypothetical protein
MRVEARVPRPTLAKRRRLRAPTIAAFASFVAMVGASGSASGQVVEAGSILGRGSAETSAIGQLPPGALRTAASKSFAISGHVTGLYPGAVLPLKVTVSNPWHFGIIVTSISASVGPGRPGCAAANLKVSPFTGELKLGAGQTGYATLEVTLAHAAPDACQGAVFPLSYRGVARKAR